MDNYLQTKYLIMKTYPFIRILIRLFTLLLIILIGSLAILIFKPLFPNPPVGITQNTTTTTTSTSTLSPELLRTISTGKKLFRTNCASCHNKNMKSDMTGPALAGVRDRWGDYPITDLYKWIKNSSKLIEAGHPKAVAIYTEWNRSPMTSFNELSNEDIEAILIYIENI